MTDRRRNIFILIFIAGLIAASIAVVATTSTKLGLDLKGGASLVYEAKPTKQTEVTGEAIDRTIEIMRERVDKFGVAEPEIQRTGETQIDISLPDTFFSVSEAISDPIFNSVKDENGVFGELRKTPIVAPVNAPRTIKDVDFDANQIVVRRGKGAKDRVTLLPAPAKAALGRHLDRVRHQHIQDLQDGAGWIELPDAVSRKYPAAGREWPWQWVFPATRIYVDRVTAQRRRHHLHQSVMRGPSTRPSARCATSSSCSGSTPAASTTSSITTGTPRARRSRSGTPV